MTNFIQPPTDDTQPKRPRHLNERLPEEDTGPGCLAWGVVSVLSLMMSCGLVALAGFAGWTEGLRVGQGNATATRSADMRVQCDQIVNDLLALRLPLAQKRFEDLAQLTPAPLCVSEYAPTATVLFINSQATATPTVTLTPTLPPTFTASPTAAEVVAATPAPTTTANPSGFDPAPLLEEARQQIASADYLGAIASLEAVAAIDPNYQPSEVNRLLFQALTAEARNLYRNNGNLAEAIVLTNRAEQYGDVGELNFERAVARSYLDAQSALNVNYPLAIRLLSDVIRLAPNYRNAKAQLYDQAIKYGDSLVTDQCSAKSQYEIALTARPQDGAATTKRDAAKLACEQGILAPTVDPNVTVDPNLPAPTATTGAAPIGQPGG